MAKLLRLIERDQRVAVVDLDTAPLVQQLDQAPSVWRHHAILTRPDDEGRPLEASRRIRGAHEQTAVSRDAAQQPDGVALDLRTRQDRGEPAAGDCTAVPGEPAEGERGAAYDPQPELSHEAPEPPWRQTPGAHQHVARESRREIVERVARDEHDPGQAIGRFGSQQLYRRAAGVVADQPNVVETQALEQLADQSRHGWQRERHVGPHRFWVGSER